MKTGICAFITITAQNVVCHAGTDQPKGFAVAGISTHFLSFENYHQRAVTIDAIRRETERIGHTFDVVEWVI